MVYYYFCVVFLLSCSVCKNIKFVEFTNVTTVTQFRIKHTQSHVIGLSTPHIHFSTTHILKWVHEPLLNFCVFSCYVRRAVEKAKKKSSQNSLVCLFGLGSLYALTGSTTGKKRSIFFVHEQTRKKKRNVKWISICFFPVVNALVTQKLHVNKLYVSCRAKCFLCKKSFTLFLHTQVSGNPREECYATIIPPFSPVFPFIVIEKKRIVISFYS